MRSVLWAMALCAAALSGLLLPDQARAEDLPSIRSLAYRQLADPAQEARARALMTTIRCLVCQGQSIADSDADLAGDMRALVRGRIAAGERPDAIRAWLIRRYGAWVSYQPPLDGRTWPLWAAPILFLAAGLLLARGTLRRRR